MQEVADTFPEKYAVKWNVEKLKQNRTVDRLIFILVNDVEEDYLHNIQRLMLNVGRIGPEERRRRTRQIKGDQINMECIPDMITEIVSNIEFQHEITVLKSEMKNCTCNDFRYSNIVCKHLYLFNRLHAGIAPFKGKLQENIVSFEQVDLVIQVDAINIAAENRVFVTEHSSMVQDNLTAEIANRLAAYRSYRENPYRLTDEQIANIRLGSELILNTATNQNFSTQRR
ncbi:hypothetical protein AB4K20DRAFT_1978406 [Rhizopus microsporus]